MKLNDLPLMRNAPCHMVNLALQRLQVGNGYTLVLLNRNVARAEKTQAFAKGKMHVEGDGRAALVRLPKAIFQVSRAKIVFPDRRSGIAGVTRPRAIVFLEKRVRDFPDVNRPVRLVIHRSHVQSARFERACATTGAACPASTNARAFSTGVFGKIPWPRFKMCPIPPVFSTASRAAALDASRVLNRISGLTLPCSAIPSPIRRRASAKSVCQSTLSASAPVRAKLPKCFAEPLAKSIRGTPWRSISAKIADVAGNSNASYSAGSSSPAQV